MESRTDRALKALADAGVELLEEPPAGWRKLVGAATAPNGWEWWAHGSRFWRANGREPYQHALVRKKP